MYCPFCGHKLRCESTFCGLCGKNLEFLYEFLKRGTTEGNTGKNVLSTVQESQALKKKKNLSLKKKNELLNRKLVKIYVGMMTTTNGELKPVRGLVLPLAVNPRVDAEELRKAAELKIRDFNKKLQGGPYFLLYPDGTKIVNIPGTDRPFTLQAYKDALGKAYQRITVYICRIEDFYALDFDIDSSDSEVIIASRNAVELCSAVTVAALSDTAVAPGTSIGMMDTACSSKYTELEDDEDLVGDAASHEVEDADCPDNGHQSTPTSISPRWSVNPFGFNEDAKMAPCKRHAYNAEFKLNAVSYAEEHGNRATAREFNVNESMVRKWRKQQDDLRQVKKTQKSFRGNKARWIQLEDELEKWVFEQRGAGRRVSTVTIRMKATVIARELNISGFKGGSSWCFRFMKRRNIAIRTPTTVSRQLQKDDQEKLATFRAYCKYKITEKKIRPEHIINMAEVPLTCDIPLDTTGARAVNVHTTENEKSSFTVVLSCQADGQKLPPMVVFKRNTLPKEKFPAGVVVKANSKGRMDEEKMNEWLREIYVKRPGGFLHTAPSLLVYDSMRSHISDDVKEQVTHTNTVLAAIPGRLTKELQPLDIGVNREFKAGLRTAWEQWMTEGEHTFTKTRRRPRTTYATICQWIINAWDDVSASTVVRAFRKAGIVSELPDNSSNTDLQLLPTDKENVETIKKESPSPDQEDLKPPHIKEEEMELAIPHLDPDSYPPPLTIKTQESDTDDSEDWNYSQVQ